MSKFSRAADINSTDEEISLADILNFIAESWQTVLVFTLLGLGAAGIFLFLAPKQYEAIVQIRMAQIASPNNGINPLGVNIEEPAALIARMTLPTTFDSQIIQKCGLADREDASSELIKSVKLSIPKGVSSTVNLKMRAPSPELANTCINALYQLIKSSQALMIAPFIKEANFMLSVERERLARVTELISRADQSGAAMSATYLATRDEIRYLLDQIRSLQNIIIQNESRASSLIAPIYVSDRPVFPSKINSLLVGVAAGGFLGLLVALARKWYRSNLALVKR